MNLWPVIIIQCLLSMGILVFFGYQLRHILIKKMATRCLLTLLISDFLHLFSVLVRVVLSQATPTNENCSSILYFENWMMTFNLCCFVLFVYDRYMFVSSPINYVHRINKKFLYRAIPTSGIVSLVTILPTLLDLGVFAYNRHALTFQLRWTTSKGLSIGFLAFTMILPLLITSIATFRIMKVLKRRLSRVRIHHTSSMDNSLKNGYDTSIEKINADKCRPIQSSDIMINGSILAKEVDHMFMRTRTAILLMFIIHLVSVILGRLSVSLSQIASQQPHHNSVVLTTFISLLTCIGNIMIYAIYNRKHVSYNILRCCSKSPDVNTADRSASLNGLSGDINIRRGGNTTSRINEISRYPRGCFEITLEGDSSMPVYQPTSSSC